MTTSSDEFLQIDAGVSIAPSAVLMPADYAGASRAIKIGPGCRIGAGAVIYGGTTLGQGVVVEEYAIVGKPEFGYAMGKTFVGNAGDCIVGDGSIIRAAAHIYSEVALGQRVHIGHHTLVRTGVSIGDETQLAHYVSVERGCRLGERVRSSPHTHLTGETVAEDRVFFGAGVKTINDRGMIWRAGTVPSLEPPKFRVGAAIGTGSTVAAGVEVGEWALVGSHSLVLHDVPPGAIAFGTPAVVKGRRAHPDSGHST